MSIDIKACSPASLAVAVDFIYGVEVPDGFADLQGLLRLADMYLLESLRGEVGRRLAGGITEQNFLKLSSLADQDGDEGEMSELELEDSDAEEIMEMEVDLPPRPSVSGKGAVATTADIAAVVATLPSLGDEEMEDEGEGEVGKMKVADTKALGEEDTGDQATFAAPSTTSAPAQPPSPLAVNDDIATAAVVDTLLGVVTHKMVVTHRAPSTSESRAMRQGVKRFVGHGDFERA